MASFHEGIISSTTLMVNMIGFEDACYLAHKNDLFRNIGVHVNLTECSPVSTKILRESNFCNEHGKFCYKRSRSFFFRTKEKEALSEEIDAQIRLFLKMGLQPTHLDSHHHIHNVWNVFEVIC